MVRVDATLEFFFNHSITADGVLLSLHKNLYVLLDSCKLKEFNALSLGV